MPSSKELCRKFRYIIGRYRLTNEAIKVAFSDSVAGFVMQVAGNHRSEPKRGPTDSALRRLASDASSGVSYA